uniref:GTPase, IMAP family member 5 n=1 Tax=Aquila chrysaetos chrysaetos TaxID=223781 RepID=A0A663FF00_AQUCH
WAEQDPVRRDELCGCRGELLLLLVGKSGAGKSATSNTLLGECVFKFATELVIVSCVQAQGCCDGEDITVIDAADIFDPKAAISEVYKEITHCIRLSSPGPHVLLLGTNLGQSIEEDKEAVQRLQDIFGVDVLRSLHNYLRYCGNGALQDLILRCGSRYCGFNNRAVGAEQDHQVTKLMGMVCYVVQENGGEWYSNDMYLEPSLMEEKVEYHMGRYKAERKMREWSRAMPLKIRAEGRPMQTAWAVWQGLSINACGTGVSPCCLGAFSSVLQCWS